MRGVWGVCAGSLRVRVCGYVLACVLMRLCAFVCACALVCARVWVCVGFSAYAYV